MTAERHTLHKHLRRLNDDPKKSRYDGQCSCGRWALRNASSEDIRAGYDRHVEEELGVEAQERRTLA